MSYVLTPRDMRAFEQAYMQKSGTATIDLMECAATGVVRAMQAMPGAGDRLAIFACGPGGNGGDGFAAARLHAARFGKAIVVPLVEETRLKGDALVNCRRARETAGVAFARLDEVGRLPTPGIWVDALFGIGLNRDPDAAAHALIKRMNDDRAAGARVLAVDIASGLNALTGRAFGTAVRATDTVTFDCMKPGHLLGDGPALSGDVVVEGIGLLSELRPEGAISIADMDSVRRATRHRPLNSHKNSYGHLLIIAGSGEMAGAAVLCAKGALRSGAGLVTVACPRSIVPIVQTLAPEAMCLKLPESDGVISTDAVDVVRGALAKKDAVAIGPGLTAGIPEDVVGAVLDSGLSAVFDADALNVMSMNRGLLARLAFYHVITPHPGEARRLLGREIDSPIDAARALSALGLPDLPGPTAIYKGAASVIADGSATCIRAGMCSGLAKGGSGDVLTGIVGALLAQGYAPTQAAQIASAVHFEAGVRAAAEKSEMGMTALDLAEQLGSVWQGDG